MKHFAEYNEDCYNQCFDMAVIVDGAGHKVGKIIIRYTKGQIGLNSRTGIIFNPADMDFSETVKHDSYNRLGLVDLFEKNGVGVFSLGEAFDYRGCDSPTDINELRFKRKKYKVYWV